MRIPRPTLASSAVAVSLLALCADAPGQVSPLAGPFELKGEGTSFLSNGSILGQGPTGLLPTHFVSQGGGRPWEHWTDTSYMGSQSYKIRVIQSPTESNDRSEQMVMGDWDIGPSSPHPDTLYFTMAFYVESPPTGDGHFYVSQLWQDPRQNPFMFVNLTGGVIRIAARGDVLRSDGIHRNVWTDLLEAGGRQSPMPLELRKWYRIMFRVTPSRGLVQLGSAMIWFMDNETGAWQLEADVRDVPMGFTTIVAKEDPRTPAQLFSDFLRGDLPLAAKTHVKWKIGTYRGSMPTTTRVYLDSVRFTTNGWNAITKNRTIGYHRNIVHLDFDETSGSHAYDRSADWNGGWGYGNTGTLMGPTRRINLGVRGSCLSFDGVNDHVRVAVPGSRDEFDTGNYLTLGAFFKTTTPQSDRGLITIDEYSTTYKAKLYYRTDSSMELAVRHPDNTLSYVRGYLRRSLADGAWHHVMGTYNRWASDGQRLKLYVDGALVGLAPGADKPIETGDNYLYAGKFSGGYFKGYLDEPMMFNYELSARDVQSIAGWAGRSSLASQSSQVAGYRTFGTGCSGASSHEPRLMPDPQHESRLVAGGELVLHLDGLPPLERVIGWLGASSTHWGPARLPLDLGPAGMPGCTLLVSPDLPWAILTSSAEGVAQWPLRLPNTPELAGHVLYQQACVTAPGANARGLLWTNAGQATIGGR